VSDGEIQDETGKIVCMARSTSVLIDVSGDEKFLAPKTEQEPFMNGPYKICGLADYKGGSRTAPTSILS